MITIKTKEEIALLREGGKRLGAILRELAQYAVPGISTAALDTIAHELIKKGGDTAAFYNYKPYGARRPYPAALCISVNNEVVHGIPAADRILADGDIVTLDLGLIHENLYTDSAVTVEVGTVDTAGRKLIEATKEALYIGIKAARAGNHIGDIGAAVQASIKPHGFGIVRDLCGHGVGYSQHEDPYVPNFGVKGRGELLKAGMVLAIEPIINEGTPDVTLLPDGYTFITNDGKRSVQWEHTIVITDGDPEILTK